MNCGVSELLGKTLLDVVVNYSNDEIIFTTNDGNKYVMFHDQD